MIDFRQKPPGIDQGIYEMPFGQYAAIPALNSSKLKHLRKTPAHFKAALEGPPKEWSAAQRATLAKGKAFDEYVLNGGLTALEKIVAVDPGWNKNTTKYKDWAELQSGKIILKLAEKAATVNMAECAFKKRTFSSLFNGGIPHRVFVWQCRTTGLWCKAEIDWITNDGIVVDLKSTADAGFWFFARNARRLGYANQLAHYLDGVTTVTGVLHDKALLAAVEVDPPHESHVFRPSVAQLLDAADQNIDRKQRLAECLESDSWPGYPDEIIDLDSGLYEETFDDDEEDNINGF